MINCQTNQNLKSCLLFSSILCCSVSMISPDHLAEMPNPQMIVFYDAAAMGLNLKAMTKCFPTSYNHSLNSVLVQETTPRRDNNLLYTNTPLTTFRGLQRYTYEIVKKGFITKIQLIDIIFKVPRGRLEK